MWPFGKLRCQACGQAFPRGEMMLSPRERGFGVCRGCVESWDRSERRCVRCQTEVKPTQQVAFSQDPKGLGHWDCGGTPIAGW